MSTLRQLSNKVRTYLGLASAAPPLNHHVKVKAQIPVDQTRPEGEQVTILVPEHVDCETFERYHQGLLEEVAALRTQVASHAARMEESKQLRRLFENMLPLVVEIVPAVSELLDEQPLVLPVMSDSRDAMIINFPSVTIAVNPGEERITIKGGNGEGEPIPYPITNAELTTTLQLVLLGVQNQVERRSNGTDPIKNTIALGKDNRVVV